ncbi:SubName: Full=Uncharacterized protein {ECO:0000313/EMBL:CCA75827.1} [Serendipita indica DSM 11827]|uniref:Uncharacterized protein n=1 Tax=Serendipita indica (strain DSM 11827) TaxID=1109443 RepID=G4TWY4_SERID|nr:SubName: Full=Uncharacterized protein {ECO:0000313/EMBL:CCA75827.1} [Serendipita indica DSM 11827]CCA75827.1 hypothetical protein PIIN_09815 [Serendipita indica DSM 11827]
MGSGNPEASTGYIDEDLKVELQITQANLNACVFLGHAEVLARFKATIEAQEHVRWLSVEQVTKGNPLDGEKVIRGSTTLTKPIHVRIPTPSGPLNSLPIPMPATNSPSSVGEAPKRASGLKRPSGDLQNSGNSRGSDHKSAKRQKRED